VDVNGQICVASDSHELTLLPRVSLLVDPLVQNRLVVRLDTGEVDTHPLVLSKINNPTQSFKVLTSVGYLYSHPRPGRQGFRCVNTAAKQAQVTGLSLSLRFRLQISQFDAGMEGITPCTMALRLHSLSLLLQLYKTRLTTGGCL
jgi:hypothetical protein